MSSKSQTAQQSRRIVPAIPLQLVRRAKVNQLESKKEPRIQDQNKVAPSLTNKEPPIQDQTKVAPSLTNKEKDGALQNGVEEKETAKAVETETAFEASEEKEVVTEKKDSNGELQASETRISLNRMSNERAGVHKPDAQARPFVTQHKARPSETLIFGGLQDSSSASPAAPSTMYMAPPSMAPPSMAPLSMAPPSMAPPPPPPQMARQMPPQDNYYPAPGPHYAPPPWMGPSPVNVNGHGFPATNGMPYHPNGLSRSPSQASSKAFGDSASVTPDAQAPFKRHAPAPAPSFPMSPLDANIKHLLDFLLSQFGKVEFADYVLDLSSASKSVTLPVHSLILGRCPVLLQTLNTVPSRRDNYTGIVHAHLPHVYYFQDPDAFVDALRFLYGAPLIDPAPLLQGLPRFSPTTGEHRSSMASRIRYALSYLTAGYTLNITDITMHGANIASQLIGWETLETLLLFASAGVSDDGNGVPTYGMHASQMLNHVVNFLVLNMTPDFVLDTSVSQLPALPRLPQSSNAQPSEQSSRPDSGASVFAKPNAVPTQHLSGIRFGQAPPTDSETSLSTKTLSSILLSLPYFLLKVVLEHHVLAERVGMDALRLIAGGIVRERERRRCELLNAMQDKSTADHVLLGEERLVMDDYGRALGLSRSRVAL